MSTKVYGLTGCWGDFGCRVNLSKERVIHKCRRLVTMASDGGWKKERKSQHFDVTVSTKMSIEVSG
jgi:hypothetical protein